jgi:hypothetical protein
MKLDKDTLIKHRFWIGLGTFLLIWLVGTIILLLSGGSAVAEKKKKYKASEAAISGHSRPKNDRFLKPWNDYGQKFRNQKDGVWQQAWRVQQHMHTWPGSPKYPLDQKLLYPTDPFSGDWRDAYWNVKGLYWTQFVGLEQHVAQFPQDYRDPKNAPPLPVQFTGGLTSQFNSVIPPQRWWRQPTIEECWLAQEDFWVRREMLHIVKDILDRVSTFDELIEATVTKVDPAAQVLTVEHVDHQGKTVTQPIDFRGELPLQDAKGEDLAIDQLKDGDKVVIHAQGGWPVAWPVAVQKWAKGLIPEREVPAGASRVFLRNDRAGWELDLLLVRVSGEMMISKESTIKNIHPDHREQALAYPSTNKALEFRLIQSNPDLREFRSYRLAVAGEPLKYGQASTLRESDKGDYEVASIDLRRPFTVKVDFDPTTSPVRWVRRFALAKQSHRTQTVALVPDEALLQLEGSQEPAPATGTTTGEYTTPSGTPGGQFGAPPGFPGGSGVPPPGGLGSLGGSGSFEDAEGGLGQVMGNPTRWHRMERNRYIQVTEQCKHMPVGMVLVLEQTYLQDALVAVANSPLRIQITQVGFRHLTGLAATGGGYASPGNYPGGEDEGTEDAGNGLGSGFPPGGGSGFPPGGGSGFPPGSSSGFPPGSGFPGPQPGPGYPGSQPTVAPGSVRAEVNANLVELSVYGIAALYKRFPPKPDANQPGEGGVPGQPGGVPPGQPGIPLGPVGP